MNDDYRQNAQDDAQETVLEYLDEIVEQLENNGEASDDLYNDYSNGDAWHHESHVDRWYNLQEAADLLGQLSEYKEDDYGLWEGQEPERAIGTQAAYTYGNAVYSEWGELISRINDEYADWEDEDEEDRIDLDDAIREWVID
jgi:exonuclease VII small subunit